VELVPSVRDDSLYVAPATIVDARLEGNLLRLDVEYALGCAVHRFELRGVYATGAEVARLYLYHDDRGDTCYGSTVQPLQFSLEPLRRLLPRDRKTTLLLYEPGAGCFRLSRTLEM
jgi:hypothetical protein